MSDEKIREGDPDRRNNKQCSPPDGEDDERKLDQKIAKDDAGMGLLALYMSFLSCL